MWHRSVSKLSTKGNELVPYPVKCVTKLGQEFVVGESLGEGGFGQIIKAKRKSDENEFAIKIIKFSSNMEDVEKNKREAQLLSQLSHNNIVRYFNSWTETAQIPIEEYYKWNSDSEKSLSAEIHKLSENGYINNYDEDAEDDDSYEDEDDFFYDDDEEEEDEDEDAGNFIYFQKDSKQYKEVKYLFIQMELCEKRTLRTAINANLYQDEAKLTKYFKEICEGLAYIHKYNIVHRDLKPANIFLTSDDVIKIGDFGLSKRISFDREFVDLPSGELPFGSLTAVCGTPIYIAPELYNRKYFNTKADIYSLGIIYFEMCSKPMTEMEKANIFPLTSERLKAINFTSYKKKFLIKNLLHLVDSERPTCEQILKILNSEKSVEELKEMIQQSRKVPHQQFKTFERVLKSSMDDAKIDLTTFFITTAVKIFELHGGRNIPMPTFLPSFYNYPDNLTTLLNTRGNSTSISNTSRIAFSYHVAKSGAKKIRRYSIGKVFEEGYFSPNEVQECVFEVVSPESNDYVNDAEILYMAKEICDNTFTNGENGICFYLNHGLIFSTVMKHCKITGKNAALFTNILMNLRGKNSIQELLYPSLSNFDLDREGLNCIVDLSLPCNISSAERILLTIFQNKYSWLSTALKQLKAVVENANKFGIDSDNIFLVPLFINQRFSTGVMFQVLKDNKVIATGGRFDSLIKRCNRVKKKKYFKHSATGISFNVENIVSLLGYSKGNFRSVDVVIIAKDKALAIPLYKALLSQGIKCEILKELIWPEKSSQRPLIVIQLEEEDHGVVYHVKETGTPWTLTEIFTGNWKTKRFSKILSAKLSHPVQQITYSSRFLLERSVSVPPDDWSLY